MPIQFIQNIGACIANAYESGKEEAQKTIEDKHNAPKQVPIYYPDGDLEGFVPATEEQYISSCKWECLHFLFGSVASGYVAIQAESENYPKMALMGKIGLGLATPGLLMSSVGHLREVVILEHGEAYQRIAGAFKASTEAFSICKENSFDKARNFFSKCTRSRSQKLA
ncbi:MAG: hypothetical protein KGJ02_01610 [Verrucomicrobiota bacterium]|nr:hypothetical protein [Verrucomicrobiota bacterium]